MLELFSGTKSARKGLEAGLSGELGIGLKFEYTSLDVCGKHNPTIQGDILRWRQSFMKNHISRCVKVWGQE